MTKPRGEHFANANLRIAAHIATQALLRAESANSDARASGAIVALDDFSLWMFDLDSTAAASATVLVPDSGSGRWHNLIPAGGALAGSSYKAPVRLATAGALAAYTRVGNVITANANGALGNIDGVAVVAGDRLLLTSAGTASDIDNGIYVATSLGAAGAKYVLTRADDANADGELVGGSIIPVQAGTAYGAEQFLITNAAAITINTTAITMVQIPNYVDLASTANGEGASLIGIEDPDAVITGAEAEAAFDELAKRQLAAVADATAVAAITAAQRVDGALVVKLDDYTLWRFEAASAAAASDLVIVPGAGTGRWTRKDETEGAIITAVADDAALIAVAAATRADGMIVVKIDDPSLWCFDAGSAAAASDWVQVPAAGTGRWLRLDAPAALMLPPVADNAALIALAATDRADGSLVVQLDTMQVWAYDLGSVAAASDWAVVPTDGTGRWLDVAYPDGGLIVPAVADNAALVALTAVDRQDGTLIVQLDTMQVWVYDLGSAAAASDWVVVPTDGVGRWLDVAHPNGGLVLPPVADNAALVALTAVDRQDGSIVVQLDTMYAWRYDLGSAAGADAWTVVPTDGVGRWVRTDIAVADAAGTTATTGGELVGLYDPNNVVTATTVGGGVRENATNLDVHRPGVPMINRLVMLGAPGPIVAGNTVTIGADVYEFNAATPPAGGTAGYIWVYQGASSADSRANFINAVNGVIDAPNITYDGAVTETMVAAAGTLLGTVDVLSADSIGGAAAPSGTATACAETLATGTDIWDNATMYAGQAQGAVQLQMTTVTITAAMIAQGTLEIEYDFTPVSCLIVCRGAASGEPYTITGDRVVLTLSGGGAPAYQVADVIDVMAMG